VAKELWNKYPATLLLAIAALLVSAAAGIPLGLLSAQKRDSWLDHLARVGAVAVAAVPGFWLGLLLIVLFGEYLGWLPTGGFGVDHHVILPALALGALPTVTVMRLTRSSFLEAQDLDYVRTARAKGLGESAVAWGHVLPNALVPTITYLGLHFGNLLGGAVVIEAIFAWPGAGQVVLQSISGRDMPVIAGYVLVSALIYVTVNLLVDVAYVILDPRVRLK
jgi:peptide/nickel transport system permease protein